MNEGKIPSFTTGGGHRRVWDKDLAVFLKAHNIPVPANLQAEEALVLIVDDEEAVRYSTERMLKSLFPSLRIEHAVDGFEAGYKVVSLMPALVLLDFKLPGLDGLKVAKSIRQDTALRGIKIVFMSGYATQELKDKATREGADDFLAKPFTIEDLKNKVLKCLPSLKQ